jgi:UDP-glucose 4-epimerase
MRYADSAAERIAVVGGGGYLGRHICEHLARVGAEFWVVGRSSEPIPEQRQIPYRSSLADLPAAIFGASTVIHLASVTTPSTAEADPRLNLDNVRFTLDLIDACVKAKVQRVIFASSGGTIYGDTKGLPAEETHYPSCSCSYAVAKLASETHLRLAAEKGHFQCTILRISNPYAGSQRVRGGQGVVSYLAKQIAEGTEVVLFGNTVRDYIYVEDVARCFGAVLRQRLSKNDIYNVSSGVGSSLVELCEAIFATFRKPAKYRFQPARPFDLAYSVLRNEKAKRELDWYPRTSLDEGLALYVKSLKR